MLTFMFHTNYCIHYLKAILNNIIQGVYLPPVMLF